jgi:hypothetical protein
MADTKNTEVPPASEPPASAYPVAPATVVRERGGWVTPLIAALVVVVTLVVGGVGGFALATATHAGARPAMQQGQIQQGGPQQGGPQQGGPQHGPQQGPGGQQGAPGPAQPDDRPDRPDDGDGLTDETEQESTEG